MNPVFVFAEAGFLYGTPGRAYELGGVSPPQTRHYLQVGLLTEGVMSQRSEGTPQGGSRRASHMNQAFPLKYFENMGLVSLLTSIRRLQAGT